MMSSSGNRKTEYLLPVCCVCLSGSWTEQHTDHLQQSDCSVLVMWMLVTQILSFAQHNFHLLLTNRVKIKKLTESRFYYFKIFLF